MYKKSNLEQNQLPNFYLPFGGKIRLDNRWVILANKIPWESIEKIYAKNFHAKKGNAALNSRVAFGALIIKEKLGTSDRETVEQIAENHYLQYFLGFCEYKDEIPFDHSLMTHFRKRFSKELLASINDEIVMAELKKKDDSDTDNDEYSGENKNSSEPKNRGKLIVDATCTPADVAYPTDLNLLNDAREKTETIIDTLHAPLVGKEKKPRTYRVKARKDYLKVAKKKRAGRKMIRKAVRKQLGYLTRNLAQIKALTANGQLSLLSKWQYKNLLVIHELYRQQLEMYTKNSHTVNDRIVSISQPHIRPIVRGKAKARVEFGAKVSASVVDGFIFADRISWNNFNEGGDLPMQIEEYRRRCGFHPESVHADKIYITKDNRNYCKDRGIRISGVPLGRPKKATAENAAQLNAQKKQLREDEISRIPIEGKFGQGKRRFGLGLIMAKLSGTAEVSIMISLLVMNLEKILRSLFCFLFLLYLGLRRVVARVFVRAGLSSKRIIQQPASQSQGEALRSTVTC